MAVIETELRKEMEDKAEESVETLKDVGKAVDRAEEAGKLAYCDERRYDRRVSSLIKT